MTFPVKSSRSVVGSNVGVDEENGHIVVTVQCESAYDVRHRASPGLSLTLWGNDHRGRVGRVGGTSES